MNDERLSCDFNALNISCRIGFLLHNAALKFWKFERQAKPKVSQPKIRIADVAQATNARVTGDAGRIVNDVTHNSQDVRAGSLFVAIEGASVDGHEFIEAAVGNGAAGVISEREPDANFINRFVNSNSNDNPQAAWLQVADARRGLAKAAACVHAYPSRDLDLIGVTGTNGKTTCAFLIAAILEHAQRKIALLGTVEQRIGKQKQKAVRTTPEASDTQRFLRRAVDADCTAAVMECSSQALDLRRCDALEFRAAAWTNLTPDHLDYHRSMNDYFKAKRMLFDGSTGSTPRVAVVNADDKFGRRLITELADLNAVTYGIERDADVMASNIEINLRGMSFDVVRGEQQRTRFQTPLVGRPHISNILLAICVGLELDINLNVISEAVKVCTGAPGRFEPVPHTGDFVVIVDYAHTEDALRNVLQTARQLVKEHQTGRVITVFGCGGDRDKIKRAPMGRAASESSDFVIATSDNPRHEDPEKILSDIEVGIEAGLKEVHKPYLKIVDRRAAIRRAIAEARSGDIVIIAGKGHEDYQIIGDDVLPFDDRAVAREALSELN